MKRLLAVLLALFIGRDALACSCLGGRGVEELLGDADGAFIGTVASVKRGEHAHSYSFKIDTSVKGGLPQNLEVDTATNSALCGTTFNQGESYLVFLNKREEKYRTSLCSGNKPTSQLTPDELRVLKR